MTVETGALQWLKWDTQEGILYKSPGLVVGGDMRPSSVMSIRRGIGNQASHFAGAAAFQSSPQIECTADSKALLEYALRAAGVLSPLKIYGGTVAYDFLQENAYINSLRISGAVDAPLAATLELISLGETEAATGGAPVDLTSDLYAWQLASVVVDGDGAAVQAFDIAISNNLQLYHTLDAKLENTKRLPMGISLGTEEVTFSVDMLQKMAWDVGEDSPAVTIGAVIGYAIGQDTIELALTGLAHSGDRPMPFERDNGLVVWRYGFVGLPGSLAIA